MTDFLIQATLSNFIVATILTVIAWTVQHSVRSASLSNLLWALVLIKMVTPPLVAIPVLEIPRVSGLNVLQAELSSELAPQVRLGIVELGNHSNDSEKDLGLSLDASKQSIFVTSGIRNMTITLAVWLAISGILFSVSAFRIIRFHWLLGSNSTVHDGLSRVLSVDVAKRLGLQRHPNILVARANIAPFVWWEAGRSVIVVSSQATRELSDEDLRLVITHEMAHIKRRDHWFRWIEWLALIGFWWNPMMWWARHQLRISEEMACDDLVLETADAEVHQYGNALLNMAELLTAAAIRPPVVASAINSGGSLEQRLKTMIADKTRKVSSSLRMTIVALATCVFPLGVVYAQDFQGVERRLGRAVEAGELSIDQAKLMLDALRRSNSSRELESKKQRYTQFMNEIKDAVEAGKLSEEEAKMKLAAVRREMFEEGMRGGRELGEMEVKKQRYKLFMAEIKAAVEAGKLTEEQAEEKLIAVRQEMFKVVERGESNSRDMEGKRRRYERVMNEIKEAVEAGKLSEEEAEMKLAAVRREMFDAGIHGESKLSEIEATKQRYKLFTEEIKAAVEAGKLSEEEAEEKLIDVRREMFEETP